MEWCSARMVAIVEGMSMRVHRREWPNGQWTKDEQKMGLCI
jgi:hypothetical protein